MRVAGEAAMVRVQSRARYENIKKFFFVHFWMHHEHMNNFIFRFEYLGVLLKSLLLPLLLLD